MKNEKNGFTLVEVLVVVAIISILSSIVLASIQSARIKGYNAKYSQEIRGVRGAFANYKEDNNYSVPPCTSFLGPLGCFSVGGYTYYDDALAPLVTAKYLNSVPHYGSWPSNSSSATSNYWAYNHYLPNRISGGAYTDWSCDQVAYATWKPGTLSGVILTVTNQTLPIKEMGYTQCDTLTSSCTYNPPTSGGINYYCTPLGF